MTTSTTTITLISAGIWGVLIGAALGIALAACVDRATPTPAPAPTPDVQLPTRDAGIEQIDARIAEVHYELVALRAQLGLGAGR